MAEPQQDILDQLQQLRDRLAPDDERLSVIDELIGHKLKSSAAFAADAPIVETKMLAPPAPTIECEQIQIRDPSLPQWPHATISDPLTVPRSALQRYPRGDVQYIKMTGGYRRLAPIFGLVAMVALGGSLAVLFLSGAVTSGKPRRAITKPIPSPAFYLAKGLPDPAHTPGQSDQKTPGSVIVADVVRRRVFAAYGLNPEDRNYVIAHLVPISLGGTDDPANLFPMTRWFGDLKVRCDKRLAELVGSREITAKQAESELKSNWVSAMHAHYVRNYGASTVAQARSEEEIRRW